jgi:hypothetical protein
MAFDEWKAPTFRQNFFFSTILVWRESIACSLE